MKKLSDYKDEEAIELWADLIDLIVPLFGDEEIKDTLQSGKPKLEIAKTILRNHKKEATEILLRIDPEPLNGLNIVIRLVGLLTEIGQSKELTAFFGFAEQEKTDSASSGNATVSTEDEKK